MTYSLIVPFIFRFLAAPAAIAVPHLGTPSAHLDSGDCQLLQHLGDAILTQSYAEGMLEGRDSGADHP